MRRPSFQFYPQDFTGNAKLKRCSWPARGVWIWVLQLMHDSDEYGVLRWPLEEIAQAVGCPLVTLKELTSKGVMKGSDSKADAYIYTPTHARRKGTPVKLMAASAGPCWYSSRMLRDEHLRKTKGDETRFKSYPQNSPDGPMGEPDGDPVGERVSTPLGAPHAPKGDPEGDGSASASASSINGVQRTNTVARAPPTAKAGEIFPLKVNGKHPPAGWHRSSEGIQFAGKLLGIPPRRGEGETEYKGRLFEAISPGQAIPP